MLILPQMQYQVEPDVEPRMKLISQLATAAVCNTVQLTQPQ